jgi:hypothetical protein
MSSPIHDKPASVITSPLKPLHIIRHIQFQKKEAVPAAADVEQQRVLRCSVCNQRCEIVALQRHAEKNKAKISYKHTRDTSVSSGSASSCRQRSASCVWMSIIREFDVY